METNETSKTRQQQIDEVTQTALDNYGEVKQGYKECGQRAPSRREYVQQQLRRAGLV